MPLHEPVRTPDERSPEGVIAGLEEELSALRAHLARGEREAETARAEARRARIRADELRMALQQKEEQFLDMLARLQAREEQAVRRASELAERTQEAEAARSRAEEAEGRLRRVLGEAGKLLGASLDLRATLTSVARLAVPELADLCVIDILDEHGRVERVASHGGSKADQALAEQLMTECVPHAEFGIHRALASGNAAKRKLDDAMLRAFGCDDGMARALAEWRPGTVLVVPMIAREQLVGAIALVAREARAAYDEDEVMLARELADRAALAVDSARLYDAALAGSRAKSEFLAVMSHELRTPLSAIIGYADLLRTGVVGEVSENQEQQLGRIRIAADHLLGMIEEILTFSQLEAGRTALQPEPLDAVDLTRELCHIVEPLAAERGLEFRMHLPDEPVPMTTDARKLRQILLNLLSNAIKFTDDGGVDFNMERHGDRVRWRVRDTGIGIGTDHVQAIFTPFWQAEQSRTRRNEGAGLGLSVSRGLAQLLGGDVEVESEPGKGSTFTVDVPAEVGTGGPEEA